LLAHIGAMDCCARGMRAAAAMIEDNKLSGFVDDRYVGWKDDSAKKMLTGQLSLEQIAEQVEKQNINPEPVSGRQEHLENLLNQYV